MLVVFWSGFKKWCYSLFLLFFFFIILIKKKHLLIITAIPCLFFLLLETMKKKTRFCRYGVFSWMTYLSWSCFCNYNRQSEVIPDIFCDFYNGINQDFTGRKLRIAKVHFEYKQVQFGISVAFRMHGFFFPRWFLLIFFHEYSGAYFLILNQNPYLRFEPIKYGLGYNIIYA